MGSRKACVNARAQAISDLNYEGESLINPPFIYTNKIVERAGICTGVG